jgi:hypothetical protein
MERGKRSRGGWGRGGPTGDILTVSCYRSASPGGGGERCALLEIADVFKYHTQRCNGTTAGLGYLEEVRIVLEKVVHRQLSLCPCHHVLYGQSE